MAAKTGELEELAKLCGDPGPPVDCLGRVNGKTYPELNDNIPDFLKAPAKETKVNTTVQAHKLLLIKDTTLDFPPLCLKVFVQPDPAVGAVADEARFARMFARSQCRRAKSVLEADLVVFSGGSDVDPQLYGTKPHKSTYFNPKRDDTDLALYMMCLEHGIPMFGVCRGAQFLHVMNGGKLYQDVDGHNGDHPIFDLIKRRRIEKISSVHHQMVMPNRSNGMQIVATAAQSKVRAIDNDESHDQKGDHLDIEAFFYRDTCCFGVQGHPEYEGYHYFTWWCLDMLQEFIVLNLDLDWDKETGNLRMKKELIEQRTLQPKQELLQLTQPKE